MPVRYELNEYASDGSLLRTFHFVPMGPVDIDVTAPEPETYSIADSYSSVIRTTAPSFHYALRISATISNFKRDAYTCTCAADPSQLCTMHRRSIL
jgi:hypothetical protein